MKKLFILAALLMASTAAHAGNSISLDIEGHHIQVAVPRNCNSLSCLQISAPGLSGSGFGYNSRHDDDDDNYSDNSPAPVQNTAPAPVARYSAPATQHAAPQPVAPAANYAAPARTPTAPTAPVAQAPAAASIATAVAPTIAAVAPAPVAAYAAPAPVATAPVAPAPVAAAAPVSDPNSPLGVWATEENKGNVSIEPCGPNLCGYAVKSGEKVLINMKPSGSKWTGRIHDPDSGSDYDSTIAMKGTNALKVQGCAFGGMFCGGQTWKRVS
ncbi:MAG TPA: DUF2147 domain-containing protein [Rhizomicrobium sp.]|jgi:uncharacterized protein (DUF2147 family)